MATALNSLQAEVKLLTGKFFSELNRVTAALQKAQQQINSLGTGSGFTKITAGLAEATKATQGFTAATQQVAAAVNAANSQRVSSSRAAAQAEAALFRENRNLAVQFEEEIAAVVDRLGIVR